MVKNYITLLFLSGIFLFSSKSHAETIRVLFIGNSYTAGNNLPQIVKDFALSNNDTLIYAAHTPGSATLQNHSTNSTVLNLIQQGHWDFVVLQEQSQIPSFPDPQVQNMFFPGAESMNNLIKQYNPCAKTLFFITWGRKNGDAQNCPNFPPLCTYQGMDSLLTLRYTQAAQLNEAILAPVGPVWRKIRELHPQLNLYTSDESHPNEIGSYAAAATFYTVLFEKSPRNISFNYNLDPSSAELIKELVHTEVYNKLDIWQQYMPLPKAKFEIINIFENEFEFRNNSEHADLYFWDFGDGNTSNDFEPNHAYQDIGNYQISLTVKENICNYTNKSIDSIEITNSIDINELNYDSVISIYPNPSSNFIQIKSDIEIQDYSILTIDGKEKKINNFHFEESNNIVLNISHLENGIYILYITDSNKRKLAIKFNVVH